MTRESVEELEAAARYRRERLALYRAKAYGSLDTSAKRLRQLEQESEHADRRLAAARREPVKSREGAA